MKFTRLAMGLALAGLSFGANATNGMFGHGYGMKAKGMGGAATASSDDAFGGANNPASMAFAGNRMDIGADVFMPIREANRVGSTGGGGFPAIDADSESESNVFLIPEFGYNRMINPNLALGVTVYGNGGMNTDYDPILGSAGVCGPATNFFCGQGRLGIDLMQLIIAPTAAYKLNASHSIGISPLLAYQRFKAEGLQGFTVGSTNGAAMTNNGYDDSFGYGVRIGYFGRITPTVTIGAAYSSKVNFDEFDDYKGLFAEQGDLDIPENYNVGIAWQATPQVKLAFDYQRINYSDVDSIGNPMSNFFPCFGGSLPNCFGGSVGPGFGWADTDVWKLGVEYKHNNQWTLRAGYSHTNSPIESSNTFGNPDFGEAAINILAPGVVEDHVTLGFTYTLASGNELTVSYMHAFTNEVSGADPFFGGLDTIKMHQNSIGIAYGMKM
ncbi:MAG: outer membrane protein transport protein [Hydrogenophilaceae bacterium]|nr:outer membrane protein transport protein [Hydrogenophilaceae bacterium]